MAFLSVTLTKGDPYYCHCHKTYRLTKETLESAGDIKVEFKLSFQSRFGPEKWLQPYTTDVLEQCAKDHQNVVIIAPGFATDCLETLEELKGNRVPKVYRQRWKALFSHSLFK